MGSINQKTRGKGKCTGFVCESAPYTVSTSPELALATQRGILNILIDKGLITSDEGDKCMQVFQRQATSLGYLEVGAQA